MRLKPRTLRGKLLAWLLIPLLTLFFLRAAYTYFYANELANRVYDRMLFTLASALLQQVVHDDAQGRFILPEAAREILLSDEFDALAFALRNAAGQVVDGETLMPPVPDPESAPEKPFFDNRLEGRRVRIVYLERNQGQEHYVLQVAETLAKRKLLAREFQSGVLLPQLLIIVLATLIVWIGIGRSLAPLKRLRKSVAERSPLDLSALDIQGIPADVRPLVRAINELMARLSGAMNAQNRFIADAAHQLRTPLAGLKTQIELMLRQTGAPDAAQMESLLASTDRMTRLVKQLLALARNEPAADSVLRVSLLDLGQLASTITMDWVPRALEKDIDLGFEASETPVTVYGDAARLTDLIDNLIDNAVRYTPQHGRVTVSVLDGARPQLVVSDNGPGIPPELRERVFERFYSVLGSGADGSGLGLSIVQEIARMHGALARIEDNPSGSGTRVVIEFPVASELARGGNEVIG